MLLRLLPPVAFCMAVAALGILLNGADISPVDTVDKLIGDYRIAWGSPRAPVQRSDIALVLITEETLLGYESRSPIDRGLLAGLVQAVDAAHPKVIGLDIILDRHTSRDAEFLQAIRKAKAPIVLGAIDDRLQVPPESLLVQQQILNEAGRPYGHLLLERKAGLISANDGVVRLVAAPYPGPPSRDAFATVVAREVGAKLEPQNNTISWLKPPRNGQPLFPSLFIPRHDPSTDVAKLQDLFQKSWGDVLKGRIVLIGASMIDRDNHTTPLSVLDDATMPGALIQAQALAQRLDGDRNITKLPLWLEFVIVSFVTVLCFFAATRLRFSPNGLIYQTAGLLIIGLVSFLSFSFYKLDLPSIALATAWAGGALGGWHREWLFRVFRIQTMG